MNFSYNWLKQYVKLPKPEKLAEILTMHAFEVESIKKIKGDYVLDIDVLPNRGPDCFSHIGIAREIAAITDIKLDVPKSKLKEDKKVKAKDVFSVFVEDKKDCIRYTARVIVNVKVKESPKWIKERLIACGLKPINNIVDAANYVMLETGQPIHAFDFFKIENEIFNFQFSISKQNPKSKNQDSKKIIVRRAKKGEKITTLDNEKYSLDKDILIIADLPAEASAKAGGNSILAIAGIKGGKKAEIDKKTKTIILESANFNSRVVRLGSKELGLRTDASWRFEHKIDPNLTEVAINRVAEIIDDIAKGKVASGLIDIYSIKAKPKKIKLDIDYVEELLGIRISEKDVKSILERLGFKYVKGIVEVPAFRLDIVLPEDLIEEIGRLYGYEKIASVFPVASLIPPKRNFNVFWEDVSKNILKELGFTEVYNYSFVKDSFGYNDNEIIELKNPMSSEQKYLRPSLIPGLLKNVDDNFKNFNQIKIFEIGKVFTIKGEKNMLSGLIAKKNGNKSDFYALKGVVDSLLNKLGISDIYYDDYEATPEDSKISVWKKGSTAEIKANGEEIGFLGRIGKSVVFDIDFEKLRKLCSEEHEYQPISQFPAAIRDLAILVPTNTKVVEVLNGINIAGGSLVRDVDLFDIYEGEGILGGKKNLAFHIIYQAEDRTLTAKEIDKIQNKIIKALEEDPRWEVRR